MADLLDPEDIPKYVDPLVIPPVMEPATVANDLVKYSIAVRQFDQQVLPTSGNDENGGGAFPMTTVWGYGSVQSPSSFNFPAFTVETRTDQRVRVRWINELVDNPGSGRALFLPHLLPVDQTLHWANPPGPRDTRGTDPEPYTGPVPIVTHVHGAHVPDVSDGYPEAWYLPAASDIPSSYSTRGSHYGSVNAAPPGVAVFEYPNDQPATTLWYHDHALGITRLNVYTGMAGFWLIRDDVEDALNLPGPAPQLGDPPGMKHYEIPIVVQDRTFNEDGSLFYPDTRAFFDSEDYSGPYFPATDISPIWNPEFFGDSIVVNGRTWPFLEVEPRLYRFRFLNGCNSRFLLMMFDEDLTFHQIGSDGGLLPGAPIELDYLLMAPAERADVIVDFSNFEVGDEISLLNLGPDEPFGGLPIKRKEMADPFTTGQVMQFRVVPLTGQGNPGEIPAALPPIAALGPADNTRDLTLNEEVSQFADIPIAAQLGTGDQGPLTWADPITEDPMEGDIEVWRILNLTEDSHPIHLHLVQFQVLDRTPFDAEGYAEAQEEYIADGMMGDPPDPLDFVARRSRPVPPEPWETGWKDTVIANPEEITRVIALFDLPGLYVWHCHILEHEDNEMMRPYRVMPAD
jgi:FtsP/CotA-like multicopper oxidase with cupredoxin domain